MKTRLTILAVCLQFMACSIAFFTKSHGTEDELNLKLRLHKGDKYECSLKMDYTTKSDFLPGGMDMSSSSIFRFQQNILNNNNDSTFLVEMVMTKINIENIINSKSTSYNSDSLAVIPDSTFAPFQKLIGKSLKYTMNYDGQLVRSDELKEFWKDVSNDSIPGEMYDALYGSDGLFSNMSQCYSFLPGKTIKTGDIWSCDFSNLPKFPFPIDIKVDYSLLDIGKNDAFIESKISISGDTILATPDGPPFSGAFTFDLTGQGMTRINKYSSMPLNTNSSITGKISLTAAGENGDTIVVPISIDLKMSMFCEKK